MVLTTVKGKRLPLGGIGPRLVLCHRIFIVNKPPCGYTSNETWSLKWEMTTDKILCLHVAGMVERYTRFYSAFMLSIFFFTPPRSGVLPVNPPAPLFYFLYLVVYTEAGVAQQVLWQAACWVWEACVFKVSKKNTDDIWDGDTPPLWTWYHTGRARARSQTRPFGRQRFSFERRRSTFRIFICFIRRTAMRSTRWCSAVT